MLGIEPGVVQGRTEDPLLGLPFVILAVDGEEILEADDPGGLWENFFQFGAEEPGMTAEKGEFLPEMLSEKCGRGGHGLRHCIFIQWLAGGDVDLQHGSSVQLGRFELKTPDAEDL